MQFSLQFSCAQIRDACKDYAGEVDELDRECKAFDAGELIAAGSFRKNTLDPIIDWKSSRPKSLIKANPWPEIREAIRIATAAEEDRTAAAVLCGLRGVGVAMASAILTAIDRRRFTVIDWRALKSLGVKKESLTLDDYLSYLNFCRNAAKRRKVSLRDLDRALWIIGGR